MIVPKYLRASIPKRSNDSSKITWFKEWDTSQTFALKTKLIHCKSDLSIVSQYRILDFEANTQKTTLNSRIIYTDRFFLKQLLSNTVFETNGTIPQQNSRT
jgi:hypothetical protein